MAFEGACIGEFADGAGQRGDDDDDVESAAGEVGHEDPAHIDLIVGGEAIVIVIIVDVAVVVVVDSR